MLNKNQSNKRNSWKYSLVIPALIGFVVLFQVQVEAQTIEIKNDDGEVIIAEKIKGGLPIEGSYVFDKISSDNELKNDVLAINAEYDINFKIYNIKRNDKGEIIAIKMSYNDKKGNKGKTEQKRNIPIRPIFLKISTDDNGKNSIGFFDNSDMVIKPKDPINEKKITTIESIKDDAVIFVDGERYTKEDLNYLDPKGLEKITVLTDKKSLERYGVANKTKVVVIETNWSTETKVQNTNKTSLIFTNPFSELTLKEPITDFNDVSNIDFNEPLILLDGKEISKKELEKIYASDISSFNVLKPYETNVIDKYGSKAKNGVIEIQTIAYYEKNNPTVIKIETKKVNVQVSDNNDGFIITKINNTNELLFYQNSLTKNKINFSFDKVKRDKNGLITAIFITLEDSEYKISKTFKNKKGIEDIFIGRQKGKLLIK